MQASLRTIDRELADALTAVVARAADAILAIAPNALRTRLKADRTPVTAADEAADGVIAEGLARLLPGLAVVSEESVARAGPLGGTFALVDPLDGTKEFVAGRDEYTVNLAIVADGCPIAGFIAAPALGLLFRGIVGRGAERLTRDAAGPDPVAIRCRRAPAGALTAVISRSHLDPATSAFLDSLGVAARMTCGSALKFCRIAEGAADVYPRLSPTSEWDTAAGHAIVTAAGGAVTTPAGAPLRYGAQQQGFAVPGFIAWGDPARQISAPTD
ncbi:MAG TPA: 3'(2'),5'-bisphosphate nucleotidase CysQ [Xanthobacteraceae bacterium]|nr:3'(2'),5'-bisphosphate nucleotidase CysQ [Xanthobacteraceae bacterium]